MSYAVMNTRIGIQCNLKMMRYDSIASRCDWLVFRRVVSKAKDIPKTIFLNFEEAWDGSEYREVAAAAITFTFFIEEILPSLEHPFILIIGSSDFSFPYRVFDKRYPEIPDINKKLDKLFNNKFFIKAFVENLDTNFPRLENLPLGCFATQESDIRVGLNLIPLCERQTNVFLCHRERFDDPQFIHRRNVSKLAKIWKISNIMHITNEIPRIEFIEHLKKSKFCICVSGGGLDACPKAFEAMLYGCIPIIKSSPMDRLWKKFPLVIIDEWNENTLNDDNLEKWYNDLKEEYEEPKRSKNLKTLSLDYWWNIIISNKK